MRRALDRVLGHHAGVRARLGRVVLVGLARIGTGLVRGQTDRGVGRGDLRDAGLVQDRQRDLRTTGVELAEVEDRGLVLNGLAGVLGSLTLVRGARVLGRGVVQRDVLDLVLADLAARLLERKLLAVDDGLRLLLGRALQRQARIDRQGVAETASPPPPPLSSLVVAATGRDGQGEDAEEAAQCCQPTCSQDVSLLGINETGAHPTLIAPRRATDGRSLLLGITNHRRPHRPGGRTTVPAYRPAAQRLAAEGPQARRAAVQRYQRDPGADDVAAATPAHRARWPRAGSRARSAARVTARRSPPPSAHRGQHQRHGVVAVQRLGPPGAAPGAAAPAARARAGRTRAAPAVTATAPLPSPAVAASAGEAITRAPRQLPAQLGQQRAWPPARARPRPAPPAGRVSASSRTASRDAVGIVLEQRVGHRDTPRRRTWASSTAPSSRGAKSGVSTSAIRRPRRGPRQRQHLARDRARPAAPAAGSCAARRGSSARARRAGGPGGRRVRLVSPSSGDTWSRSARLVRGTETAEAPRSTSPT